MMRKTRKIGDGSVVDAFIGAVRDLRDSSKPEISPVPDDLRIDGKTCLVTGANSGLGRAAAIDLARRGGHVILACRPGHTETPGEIRRLSGSNTVEMVEVDLADMESVHRCCDELAQRDVQIDIALMNAGLVTRESRKTPQGYETTFAVNFLSKRVMIHRWLEDGVIRPSSRGRGDSPYRVHLIGIAPVRARDRLRSLWRIHRVRTEGEPEVLQLEQAGPLHLRGRAFPAPEPKRARRRGGPIRCVPEVLPPTLPEKRRCW